MLRLSTIACLAGIIGCQDGTQSMGLGGAKSLQEIPDDAWSRLATQSYFFGHQSVGVNLVEGLHTVLRENPQIELELTQSENAEQLHPGVLLHSRIGTNRQPVTKLQAFEAILEGGIGGRASVAFLKFCYLDAGSQSDMRVEDLFEEYKNRIEALRERYPQTRFVHFTMPLRTVPEGVKVGLKNFLGRDDPQYLDNVERNRFNEMIRSEYLGKEPLFDLARLESVVREGHGMQTFRYRGETYESLSPGYTYDGGHLNEEGKRWLAEQLLIFLAELE